MDKKAFITPKITFVKLDLTITATETSDVNSDFFDGEILDLPDAEAALVTPG